MKAALFLLWLCCPFLGVFAQTKSDTLTTITGLKYVSIVEGTGAKPQNGNWLTVHYTGRLSNGTIFDSSTEDNIPFRFKIGKREVIPGWDEGFLLMREGGKALLIIPPHLAYGEKGSGYQQRTDTYTIPPNSTLIFEVELLKVK